MPRRQETWRCMRKARGVPLPRGDGSTIGVAQIKPEGGFPWKPQFIAIWNIDTRFREDMWSIWSSGSNVLKAYVDGDHTRNSCSRFIRRNFPRRRKSRDLRRSRIARYLLSRPEWNRVPAVSCHLATVSLSSELQRLCIVRLGLTSQENSVWLLIQRNRSHNKIWHKHQIFEN